MSAWEIVDGNKLFTACSGGNINDTASGGWVIIVRYYTGKAPVPTLDQHRQYHQGEMNKKAFEPAGIVVSNNVTLYTILILAISM